MALEKLYLRPVRAGYATLPPPNLARRASYGGRGRYGAGIPGGASLVNVTFQGAAAWQYECAFFRNRVAHGSEPFLIDLILDSSGLAERTAYYVPGTRRLTSFDGVSRTFGFQLDVWGTAEDADADSDIVDAWGTRAR